MICELLLVLFRPCATRFPRLVSCARSALETRWDQPGVRLHAAGDELFPI